MKLTQCQRIIRHLQEIGPIDDLTAYSEYGDLYHRGCGSNFNKSVFHFDHSFL